MAIFERQPQTVRLDGETVRTIREAKGLTQLYVAEVVGVTVDTVSRWENNRTASVRRDNLEALAKALEVSAEELLRKEDAPEPGRKVGEEVSAQPPNRPTGPPQPESRIPLYLPIIALGLIIMGGLWFILSRPARMVSAKRMLPAYMVPGTIAPVVVEVTASGEGKDASVVVTETIPPGWAFVGSAPPPDQGPGGDGVVKWIVALKDGKARVTYVVRAPPGAGESTKHLFGGEVVATVDGGKAAMTMGPARLDLEYVHWADGDADFRIDDAEVLSALERTEAVKGFGLNPADLRALWGAGTYYWDRQKGAFEIKRKP